MEKSAARKGVIFCILTCMIAITGLSADGDPEITRQTLESAYGGKRLALVIGINQYRDPGWRELRFAVKDAKDVARALADPEQGHFKEVVELTDPDQTTRDNIIDALRDLDNRNMATDDVVFIYISTHGTLARDDRHQLHQYLVASDTEFENVAATALDVEVLMSYFNNLSSRRKVLMLATCHSGMGKSELPADIMEELGKLKSGFFVKPVETASEASVVIGVCSWGETAQEDPALENDIYTHFFVEGMGSYDRNNDGAVSVSEAHDYAQRKTYYYTQGRQRPFVRSDILGTDPIILTGRVRRTGDSVVLSYSEKMQGAMISINGRDKGAFPDGFTTEPGWNRIRALNREGDKNLFTGLVYIREGERIDIDRLVEARSGPNLGVVTSYRVLASPELSEEVLPGMPMYGLSYRVGAFPTMNTETMIEAAYGRTQWTADIDDEYETDLSVDAFEANAALTFASRANKLDLFAGPLVGVFYMNKEIEVPGRSDQRQASTVYPGAIGGIRFRIDNNVHVELSDRVSYHLFNANDEYEGALVNEVSATVYLRPRAIMEGEK